MANLKVFVSSTCYDLGVIRAQLKGLIEQLGFEPILSEYKDVLFDPRTHTHTSCVEEVSSADIVILLIGGRYGGRAVPEAVSAVDIESLMKASKSLDSLKSRENLSVTQLEVLKAIESRIPVFAFVDDRVMHDHATYEKNKNKEIISQLEFASIEKSETAKFIFEFINFLRHRSSNNAIINFGSFGDLEDAIKRQFSALFQKLLSESRRAKDEIQKISNLSDQLEALKAAVLTAVGTENEKKVARAVVRFRRMVEFLREFGISNILEIPKDETLARNVGILRAVGIVSIFDLPPNVAKKAQISNVSSYRPTTIILMHDGSVLSSRYGINESSLEADWKDFFSLPEATRGVVFGTLSEMYPSPSGRFIRKEKIKGDDLRQSLIFIENKARENDTSDDLLNSDEDEEEGGSIHRE